MTVIKAILIDSHRSMYRQAHREGLLVMKSDALFRIALAVIDHDRVERHLQIERQVKRAFDKECNRMIRKMMFIDWPILVKRPWQVVRINGI